MIDWDIFWKLMIFSTILTLTPGLNNVLVFLYTLHFGVKKAIIFRCGVFVGFPGLCFVVLMFLKPFMSLYPESITYLKYFGTVLMLYIAYKIAFSFPDYEQNEKNNPAKPMGFWGGIFLQLINGKAWAMAFIGASIYSDPIEPIFTQAFTVWLGFLLPNIYCTVLIIMLALAGKNFFKQKHIMQNLNYFFAIIMTYTAISEYI